MLTGVDVLRIGELDRLLRRPWFRAYAFAAEELDHAALCGPSRAREFLAGRFAAKEAVVKALGVGFGSGVRPHHVTVRRSADGAPSAHLSGAAARVAARLRLQEMRVSIAHKDELVVATAVATQHPPPPPPATHRAVPHPPKEEGMSPQSTTPEVPPAGTSAEEAPVTAFLRVRMAQHDAHYGGGLIDGARIMQLFGDLLTEITVRTDGDEGLLSEYSDVRFTAPVHPGDYLEATARLVRRTRLRRVVALEAHRVIAAGGADRPSAAQVLTAPQLVCRATATTVVPMGAASSRKEQR
ncbi:holo-ACP synthase [Streptomyces sp. NPDC050355]|uniref:holo-ACP synthase n=1 Tax=Streptomyces sp. NPDC050355 TaxID=3365609 RepID=UPI00378DE394